MSRRLYFDDDDDEEAEDVDDVDDIDNSDDDDLDDFDLDLDRFLSCFVLAVFSLVNKPG